MSSRAKEHFEYAGNLHVHSLYSDGGGSVSHIAQCACRVGLDFVILNDHAHMAQSLHLEEEGFHHQVLVLMGMEIGTRYHHYLSFDLKEMIEGNGLNPQEVIRKVGAQGGLGFLAHPFEKGMPFSEKSVAYTWNDLSVTGYTGVCIWNFTSRWKERIKTPLHGLFFLLFKAQMLKGPSKETLSFWDEGCRKGRVVAIGGSDAHGSPFQWGIFRFTPLTYDYLFRTINTHILLESPLPEDLLRAKEAVYGAMKEGRLFIAHEKLGSARGFRFYLNGDSGKTLCMGQESSFEPGVLHIECPSKGEIRLIRDGKVQKTWRARDAACRILEKGVYRVEVYQFLFPFGWRPWIFSNPIYLR